MKQLLFLLLFLGSSLFSPLSESSNTHELILNDSNKEPFTTQNNDGFLDIILTEAFRRIGLSFKTVHLPPERGLLSANDGIIDGDVNRIAGLEKTYTNLLPVPEKIRDSDFCALSRNRSIINTAEALKNQVIGHIKGWKIYDNMMKGAKNVITASSPQQLFRLLNKGRITVALYTCVEGMDLVKRSNMKPVYILKPVFTQQPMYIYLHKRHAALLKKLSKALYAIKKEGLYDRLYHEKILPYYQLQEQIRE